MDDIQRARAALKRIQRKNSEDEIVYGWLGRKNSDGTTTFAVQGRKNYVYVKIRQSSGAQTTAPARNDMRVEWSADLPVKMRVEGTTLVIVDRVAREDLATLPDSGGSVVPPHIHDDRYFTEAEHVSVSAGAADAAKPVVLDAGGKLDATLIDAEDVADIVGTMVTGNTETGIAVTYQDADNTLDFVVDDEYIQDLIGAMVSGNTETNISVTYDDTGAKLNFVVATEDIQDIVGAMVSGGTETNISVTYDDTNGRLDFIVSTNTEEVQDAIGTILVDSTTIDFAYTDATPAITAIVIDDSITNAKLANVPEATVKGSPLAAGTVNPVDLTAAQLRAIANVADGADVTGTAITALATKTTPVDADAVVITDSAASDAPKRTTWANIKATLKTYFDTLYELAGAIATHAALTATHGATGAIVGTTNTQTLTNKTLTAPVIADFTSMAHDHADVDDGGAIVGYIKADGSVVLTAEWDIGEDMAIRAERIEARDAEGLRLEDDGGVLGMFIQDATGYVGILNATPGYALDIKVNVIRSQMHFSGTNADSGGYMVSASANNFFMSGGAHFDTPNWIAKSTSAGIFGTQLGTFEWFGDTGLTAGNNYTPTSLMFLTAAGLHIGSGATPTHRLQLLAGTSTNDAAVGGALYVSTAQVGNVGTGEDVLASYSVPANTLAVNGQSLWFEATGTFASTAATKKLVVRFGTAGTTLILDTVAGFGGTAEVWRIRGRIIRTGAATQKADAQATITNALRTGVVTNLNQTLSGAVDLRILGEATNNNDILIETLVVGWDDANS